MRKRIIGDPIGWYYVSVFLRSADFIGALFTPFLREWGHVSQDKIHFLQTWCWIWVLVFDFPTGVLADRIPRKYMIAGGLCIAACGFALYGSAPKILIFLIGEFLVALGMAMVSGAQNAWLAGMLRDLDRPHESDATAVAGRTASLSSIARMSTGIMGMFIAARWGLNAPIICAALPIFCAGCIMLLLPEPMRQEKKRTSMLETARIGIAFVWRNKALRSLAISMALVDVAGYFVIWLYQPLMIDRHASLAYFTAAHFVLSGSQLAIAGSFSFWGRVFGSHAYFVRYAGLLTAVAFFVAAYHPSLPVIFFFVVVAGGFGLTRSYAMFGLINAHVHDQEIHGATIRSAISTAQQALRAVLNIFVGLLAVRSLRLTLGLLALLPLIAFLMPQDSDKAE